uniref:uncharacterized protein LOC118527608 n=1 Tax=Halichoerus grypus TaxID=9711 RepID=UPI0016590CB4|nr:uncharacterized protein LOC118527608 [Halichoerus grypus]
MSSKCRELTQDQIPISGSQTDFGFGKCEYLVPEPGPTKMPWGWLGLGRGFGDPGDQDADHTAAEASAAWEEGATDQVRRCCGNCDPAGSHSWCPVTCGRSASKFHGKSRGLCPRLGGRGVHKEGQQKSGLRNSFIPWEAEGAKNVHGCGVLVCSGFKFCVPHTQIGSSDSVAPQTKRQYLASIISFVTLGKTPDLSKTPFPDQ